MALPFIKPLLKAGFRDAIDFAKPIAKSLVKTKTRKIGLAVGAAAGANALLSDNTKPQQTTDATAVSSQVSAVPATSNFKGVSFPPQGLDSPNSQIPIPEPTIPDTTITAQDGRQVSRRGIFDKFGVQALTGDEAKNAGLIPKSSQSELFFTNESINTAGFNFSSRDKAIAHNQGTPVGQLKIAQTRLLDTEDAIRAETGKVIQSVLDDTPEYKVFKEAIPILLRKAMAGDVVAEQNLIKAQSFINATENHASTLATQSIQRNVTLNRQHAEATLAVKEAKTRLLEQVKNTKSTNNPVVLITSKLTGLPPAEAVNSLKTLGKQKGFNSLVTDIIARDGDAVGINRKLADPTLANMNANAAGVIAFEQGSEKAVVNAIVGGWKQQTERLYAQAAVEVENQNRADIAAAKLKGVNLRVPTGEALDALIANRFTQLASPRATETALQVATGSPSPAINELFKHPDNIDLVVIQKLQKPDTNFELALVKYKNAALAGYERNQSIYNRFYLTKGVLAARLDAVIQRYHTKVNEEKAKREQANRFAIPPRGGS